MTFSSLLYAHTLLASEEDTLILMANQQFLSSLHETQKSWQQDRWLDR